MDDGLFQLLFLGVLILASVFDAATRGRRRRRRMEEMEREEQAEAAGEVGGAATTTARRRRNLPRPQPSPEGADTAGEREMADSMVPDDLWAVLTGQRPPAEGAPVEGGFEPAPSPEPYLEPEIKREPRPLPEAVPVPEAQPVPAPWTPEPRLAPMPTSPVPPPVRVPSERAQVARTTPIVGSRYERRVSGHRSDGLAAAYAGLLRAGGADSLREAIVLTEVLGAPKALRPPGWGWEDR